MTGPQEFFEVSQLFTRYVSALDNGDVEALVDCFTEDAVIESPIAGSFLGHEGIRKFAQFYRDYKLSGAQMRHNVFDISIEADGEDLLVTGYLLITHARENGLLLQPPGQYRCRLKRQGERLLFQDRMVVMDAEVHLTSAD